MRSSFVSYSRWIYLIISWKSLLISNLVVTSVKVRSSSVRITSYSTTLLEVEKLRQIACFINSPISDCKIRLTPDPDTLDALSTWSVHHCSLGWSTRCACFLGSSAIKLVITYPFSDNLGWYLILYSLNSIAHFSICHDRSSLCRVTRSG